MELMIVGVNYRTAPVEIREQLAFVEEDVTRAMQALNEHVSIFENVIISTCNRTEIYVTAESYDSGVLAIQEFLSTWFSLPLEVFQSYLFIKSSDQMVNHLLTVTSGIDSMVLGETQILGQIRQVFLSAQSIGTTHKMFNRLFKEAVTFAKKVHRTTNIASNAVSIAYAAVQLANQTLHQLHDKHIVILGAGEMGELTLKNLRAVGVRQITLINRTYSTAEKIASQYNVAVKPLETLGSTLVEADVLISSTASPDLVIEHAMMQEVMALRKQRPIHLIDIALPRDIDEKIGYIPNVHLADIDHLQLIVDENLAEREKIAVEIREMIEMEVRDFSIWRSQTPAFSTIEAIQRKGESIQQKTLQSMYNKMPTLTAREKAILDEHTQSIVNQLLKESIYTAKDVVVAPNGEASLQLIQEVFGVNIDNAIDEEESLVDQKSMVHQQVEACK